jgi:hypothetical protein
MCMQFRYIPHVLSIFRAKYKTYHKSSVDAFDSCYELGVNVQIILIKLSKGFVLNYL